MNATGKFLHPKKNFTQAISVSVFFLPVAETDGEANRNANAARIGKLNPERETKQERDERRVSPKNFAKRRRVKE